MQEQIQQKFRWIQRYQNTNMARVPKKSGLYAYGKIRDVCGLEKKRDIVYIGETNDLHRRLWEHTPNKEKNAALHKYLREEKGVICWYCPLENFSKSEIREIERLMIKEFKPKFCTQHNTETPNKKERQDVRAKKTKR